MDAAFFQKRKQNRLKGYDYAQPNYYFVRFVFVTANRCFGKSRRVGARNARLCIIDGNPLKWQDDEYYI